VNNVFFKYFAMVNTAAVC